MGERVVAPTRAGGGLVGVQPVPAVPPDQDPMRADPDAPAEPARPSITPQSADPPHVPGSPVMPARLERVRGTQPADPPHVPGSPATPARLGVSGTQVVAGVLASVSATVVTSFFGVGGTVAGAAVVGLVVTVGNAAYSLGIRRTTARVQQLQNMLAAAAGADTGPAWAIRSGRAASGRAPTLVATAAPTPSTTAPAGQSAAPAYRAPTAASAG
jgi:hypothetical protein